MSNYIYIRRSVLPKNIITVRELLLTRFQVKNKFNLKNTATGTADSCDNDSKVTADVFPSVLKLETGHSHS